MIFTKALAHLADAMKQAALPVALGGEKPMYILVETAAVESVLDAEGVEYPTVVPASFPRPYSVSRLDPIRPLSVVEAELHRAAQEIAA